MKKLLLFILCAALSLNVCGCVWFMSAEDPSSTADAAEPVSSVTPAPTPVDDSAKNPVSLFYSSYYSACEALEDLCKSRLEADAAKEAADTLVYLADHDMRVSEGRATFGWLLSTDTENYFSSAVYSAASGSGSISILQPEPSPDVEGETAPSPEPADQPNGASLPVIETVESSPLPLDPTEDAPLEYSLSFDYSTGRSLTGTLSQNRLLYTASGETPSTAEMILEDSVWISTVTRSDGIITEIRCDEAGFHFSVSRLASKSGEPELIYSWTSDSSGLKSDIASEQA